VVALGAFLSLVAGGFAVDRRSFGSAAALVAIVVLFASMTPLIEPSGFSIGSLFSYLGAIAIGAASFVALSIRGLARGAGSDCGTGARAQTTSP
jgi:hypothetical protein